jgi:H+/gluconate symporter-like permease
MFEVEEIANIAMICLLMGLGIFAFIGIVSVYFVATEFFETFYTEGWDD